MDGFLNRLGERFWFGRMFNSFGFKSGMLVVNINKYIVPVFYSYNWLSEIVHVRDRGIKQVKEKVVIV